MRTHNFIMGVVILSGIFYAIRYTSRLYTQEQGEIIMQSTPLGVKYTVLQAAPVGAKKALPGTLCKIHYTGWLADKDENPTIQFDSSVGRDPFTFMLGVGSVIKGFDDGITDMAVGEKRRLIIPSHLGYGDRGAGPIPPYATLIFDVELVG